MSYTDSRKYYQKPAVIQSRESSASSRASSSRSSTEGVYQSSRTSMANPTYEDRAQVKRVPDNAQNYVKDIVSSNGRNVVHQHKKSIYIPEAPLASRATSGDYRREERAYKEEQRRPQR